MVQKISLTDTHKEFRKQMQRLKDGVQSPEELEEIKQRLNGLKERMLNESKDFKEMHRTNAERVKMEANRKTHPGTGPGIGSFPMPSGGGMPNIMDPTMMGAYMRGGINPNMIGGFGGFPTSIMPAPSAVLEWACPSCGCDQVNYKQFSTKQRKRFEKDYAKIVGLDATDAKNRLKKGAPYCMRCSDDNYTRYMTRMTYNEILELQKAYEEEKLLNP